MGDRSVIYIKQNRNNDAMVIYAHWAGADIASSLKTALRVAKPRVGDISYFNRIIIQNVLNSFANPDKETGAGVEYAANKKGKFNYFICVDNPEIIIDPFEEKVIINDGHDSVFSFDRIINEENDNFLSDWMRGKVL